MWTLVDAAGGVALLVFGVRFLRKGLDRLLGDRIGPWLDRLSGGRVRAALFGLMLSLAVPSSTTLSLLTVGQIRQRRLSVAQSLAILLGGGVGITSLVYLVAFDLQSLAALPVLAGVALFQGQRHERFRGAGQVLISLGLILVGAGWLKAAAAQAATWPDLATIAGVMGHYPFLAMLFGAALTVLLQSSTATVAAVMSMNGLMGAGLALPLVLGANVGIAVTTLIVGWRDPDSRRLGWGLLTIRAAVALALMAVLPSIEAWLTPLGMPMGRMLAVAHTGFNVVALGAGLVLLGPVSRLIERAVPVGSADDDPFRPVYLDKRWADEPQVAFTQSKREIARMASLVSAMLTNFWTALKSTDEELARKLNGHDDHVDHLNRAIKVFLTRDISERLPARLEATRVSQLRFLSALETVGDIIEGDLAEIALKKISRRLDFSPDGWGELERFYHQVAENLEIAAAAFVENDASLARKLLRHEESIRTQEQTLALRHFERLQTGQRLAMDTTDLHLELLTHLKHINHLLAGVAYGVLESAEGGERVLPGVRAAG